MSTVIPSSPVNLTSGTSSHTFGLSGSGIDVDAQVKSLMTAAVVPYTKMWQQEQQTEWRKNEYNTYYNSINTFNTTVFNNTLQSNLMVQMATSSNTSVATATANADAVGINHNLVVTQLATGVNETSTRAITAAGNSKSTLESQFNLSANLPSITAPFAISITNNGTTKSITVDPNQSIYALVSQINNAGANVKANYDATLDRFFISTTNAGASAKLDFSGSDDNGMDFLNNFLKLPSIGAIGGDGATSSAKVSMVAGEDNTSLLKDAFTSLATSGSFNLKLMNGAATKTINIDPSTMSLDDVNNAINTAGVNANASYDAATGKFTLKATEGTLSLAGSDQAALNFLTDNLNVPASASGQDAQFTLDGASLTQPSNKFTISGVTYNLFSTGTTTMTVAPDIDKMVSNVQAFVDSYNTMLSSLTTEVGQSYYKDYLPLTDEQKSSMKDSDITAWNAKAKSGLLRNDSILQETINTMRNNFSSPVSGLTGKYTSAASIGITTAAYSSKENGKLHLDAEKLKAALQDDPEIVNKMFGTVGNSKETSSQGIAVRLHDSLNKTVAKIKVVAGTTADTSTDTNSNLAKKITDYTTRLSALGTKLQNLQKRYYTQFSAMETALKKLDSQNSMISQMSGSK